MYKRQGENWTASYGIDSEFVIGHMAKGLDGCAINRFYVAGSAQNTPLTGIGSDSSPTCYPIVDNSILEWRILEYDDTEASHAEYYVPVREKYLTFLNPLSFTIGDEEESETPPAPTINPIIDNTVICFKTKPICVNLADFSFILRGEGYYV